MSATAVRSQYASLLTSTLPAVIRSEAENERHISMLEELDRKGKRMTAAERRLAELLTLLVEDFEERQYAVKAASPDRCSERTDAGEQSKTKGSHRRFRNGQHCLRSAQRKTQTQYGS